MKCELQMQLISYKDDVGNTYWLVYDPCSKDKADQDEALKEISENGWDVKVRVDDVDMEELISLKELLDQYLGD